MPTEPECPICRQRLPAAGAACVACGVTMTATDSGPDSPATTQYDGELRPGMELHNGRFILRRKLGEGGMGAVWLAIDRNLNRQGVPIDVALKFVGERFTGDAQSIEFLRKEVVAARDLRHDNVVAVYDWHEQSGEPAFYSMQYIDGEDLKQFVSRTATGRLTCQELDPLLEPLLAALEYAHKRGVIHRDLKPANIMIGRNGNLLLADFGLARPERPGANPEWGATTPGGTLGYSSPQQRRGEVQQISDDIYSLGATLYHLLTGELPYSIEELRSGAPLPAPRDPRRVLKGKEGAGRRDITAEAAFTLMRCLNEDPAQRPPVIDTFRRWWKYGADPE